MPRRRCHYLVQLVIHSVLAECLATHNTLRSNLLKAYATQKISQMEKELKLCTSIRNIQFKTHRNLCNRKIISYEAEFLPKSSFEPVQDQRREEMVTEKECRRTVQSSHSHLTQFFGTSCNDFSDTKYHSRQLEIVFECYRLIIDPKEEIYSIQYKKCQSSKLIFLPTTLTLEAMYTSLEGPIHVNPLALKVVDGGYYIGVATFLDSKDLSVKTTYLKHKNVLTLYQRVGVDDYSKTHPFILELEEDDQEDALFAAQLYFQTACRLTANLPNAISQEYLVLPPKFKPIHSTTVKDEAATIILPKLDGYPGTLRFYASHFVVSNSMKSYSRPHKLSPSAYHILKDYRFQVESELYNDDAWRAMAIIDLQTGAAFNAKTRYEIMQLLRQKFQGVLANYNIFFNSAEFTTKLSTNGIKRKREEDDDLVLRDGKIYEVLLNDKHQVIEIVRERIDKLKPNSGKLIRAIVAEKRKDR